MIKPILLVCAAFLLWPFYYCQAGDAGLEKGFGFTAGAVSGIGFAKRDIINDKTGAHGSQWGLVLWKSGNDGWADIGYQRMRFIDRKESSGLYFLYGAGAWYSGRYADYIAESGSFEKYFTQETNLMPGAGLGIEIGLEKHLKLNIELTMTLIIGFSNYDNVYADTLKEFILVKRPFRKTSLLINPIPQLSLIYYY